MSHADRISAYYLGRFAEYATILFLIAKGYSILAHRYKTPVGEIDLIATTDSELVLIEVKARKHLNDAAHALSPHQQQRLRIAASYVIAGHPRYADRAIRFDCCAVTWYMRIRHIKNAF